MCTFEMCTVAEQTVIANDGRMILVLDHHPKVDKQELQDKQVLYHLQ